MSVNHNFRKLKIWEDGILLVTDTYKIIETFPNSEKFNLISQLARCSVSIPSNIAEGSSKSTNKHFKTYLETSLGSAFEWETQMIVARNLNFINKDTFDKLIIRINNLQKMISKFKDSL